MRSQSEGTINTGGTMKTKGKKMVKDSVADCFKPETVGIHMNKGGDGFEAWKGNKRVIKKLKLGIKKEE